VAWGEVSSAFGPNFAKALEKRPWMASEMLRLRRKELGMDGEAKWDAGMEVDEA
jgi:hypothetical protein